MSATKAQAFVQPRRSRDDRTNSEKKKTSRRAGWRIPLEFSTETVKLLHDSIGNRTNIEKFIECLKAMLSDCGFIFEQPPRLSHIRADLARIQMAAENLLGHLDSPRMEAATIHFLKEQCEWWCDPEEDHQLKLGKLGPAGRFVTSSVRETQIAATHLLRDVEKLRSRISTKGGGPPNRALWAIGTGIHTVFREAGLKPSSTFMGPYEQVVSLVLGECGQAYSVDHIHRLARKVHQSYKQRERLRQQMRGPMRGSTTGLY